MHVKNPKFDYNYHIILNDEQLMQAQKSQAQGRIFVGILATHNKDGSKYMHASM